MVSAFSEAERVTRARDSGIDYYLVKPLSPRVLLEHMMSVLQNPRTHIEAEKYAGPDRRHRSGILPVGPTVGGRPRTGEHPFELPVLIRPSESLFLLETKKEKYTQN